MPTENNSGVRSVGQVAAAAAVGASLLAIGQLFGGKPPPTSVPRPSSDIVQRIYDSVHWMTKRFELLIFDWDGTLMDSAAAIVASIQAACHDLKLPVPAEDKARFIIGLGLHDALAYILPELDPAQHPLVAERYRYHFLLRDSGTALFPGAAETIKELHAAGFLLAVATGKSRRGLNHALEATGLAPFFHATRCADEGFSKPHPGMLDELMSVLGVAHDRTLMIGDTTHDMAMAQSACVARLAAAYGAHLKQELLAFEPLACVEGIAELRTWLLAHA